MKAGRELDALIAEKVMGWKNEVAFADAKSLEDHMGSYKSHVRAEDFPVSDLLPHYSTDIAAAWDVVQKLDVQDVTFQLNRHTQEEAYDQNGETPEDCYMPRWECRFNTKKTPSYGEGGTAAESICIAALGVHL